MWPRDFVQRSLVRREMDTVEGDPLPKLIKFADEEAFKPDPSIFDWEDVSVQFILNQMEDFFLTRRSVVLVDLNAIEKVAEVVKAPVKKPVDDDPDYIPPPSSLPPDI